MTINEGQKMNTKNLIFKKYSEFFIKNPPEVTKKVVNGAGPAGKGHWVRDTLFYKLSVTDAANVHDFLYSEYCPKSVTRKDADDMFLELMMKELKKHSKISQMLNKPLIYSYYYAVRSFGWKFWTEKKIDW